MRKRYETLRVERDTLRERCSELEKERDSLMDQFDAQEVEARELQPAAEEPPRGAQQAGRYDLKEGTAVRLEPITFVVAPRSPRASTPAGPSTRLPATPSTPIRRPSYGPAATLSSSHGKTWKTQSMPCRTTYTRGQNRFSPLTPVSNPRTLAGLNFEIIQEEPPSPTEERMRRATPPDHPEPEPGPLPANGIPVAMEDEARVPDAMDEAEDEGAPQPEPEPEPQSTTSLYNMGRSALYQFTSAVTSPIRLLGGRRGVESSMQQAEEPASEVAAPDPDPMAVDDDYESTEEGSVFILRDHTPSAGFTPPVTPPRRHDPFSLRGSQRDRWKERVEELEAEVKELEDELQRALQHGNERDARVRELERALEEKGAVLKRLVEKLEQAMPAVRRVLLHLV